MSRIIQKGHVCHPKIAQDGVNLKNKSNFWLGFNEMPKSAQKSNFCHTTLYEGVCKGSEGKFQAKKVF